MLLIEGVNIKKHYGDRLILNIENLKIYSEDRIGLVGLNGAGKTTLINILCGETQPDEGWVRRYGSYSVVDQLFPKEYDNLDKRAANKFGVVNTWNNHLSGGEKTRFKMANCFDSGSNIIFADEPTSNLDVEGIELIDNKFKEYPCNYTAFKVQKDLEIERKLFEFQQYGKDKKSLRMPWITQNKR